MKPPGHVHIVKIATKTKFEGNLTLRFGCRFFFHLFLDAAQRARNHHFLSTNPFFSPQDLGIEQKWLKAYGTAISRRFQPCKDIPPTPMAIALKLNLKRLPTNSWPGKKPSNWVGVCLPILLLWAPRVSCETAPRQY